MTFAANGVTGADVAPLPIEFVSETVKDCISLIEPLDSVNGMVSEKLPP